MTRPQSNKEIIFDKAISMFAARGFRGTSIRDIAHSMNISVSSIYHHFGNKEGLVLAIIEHCAKGIIRELARVEALDLPPREWLERLITTHVQLSRNFIKEAKVFLLDEEHLSPEGEKISRTMQKEIYHIYRKPLQELKDMGQITCKSLGVLVLNVLAVINWKLRWYRPDGPMSLDEIAEEITCFILYGVLGRSKDRKED